MTDSQDWFWKVEWCNKRGLSPYSKENWDQATEAYLTQVTLEPLPTLFNRDFLLTLALALELHPKSRCAAPPLEALDFVEWCFEEAGETELFEHFKNPLNVEETS